MNGTLPPNLRVPAPADPEVAEDFRNLLEEIIRQNAEILERLDDEVESDLMVEYQKPTIVQVFETVFSWETVCIVLVIALLVIPLFRLALD